MRGRSLHIHALVIAGVIASTIAAVLAFGPNLPAVAASPNAPCNSQSAQVLSCHFSNSFADPDYCGTGQTVDLAFDGRFTVPVAPNALGSWNNSESHGVLTDPATGATVLIHSAFRFTTTLTSGDPSAVHTVLAVFKGAGEIIRDAHGGLIARDAGNLAVEATYNGGDFVSAKIVDRGGHSLFANGDCGVLVPALGLA